jgi:hypothetical protein
MGKRVSRAEWISERIQRTCSSFRGGGTEARRQIEESCGSAGLDAMQRLRQRDRVLNFSARVFPRMVLRPHTSIARAIAEVFRDVRTLCYFE